MLIEAIHGVEHEVEGDHLRSYTKQDEWQCVERVLQCLLNRMEAPNIEPVESVRRMMDGVQSPEGRGVVGGHVQRVAQQLGNQQHESHLYPDGE